MLYFMSLIACVGYTYIATNTKKPLDYAIAVGFCLVHMLALSVLAADKVILELTKLH